MAPVEDPKGKGRGKSSKGGGKGGFKSKGKGEKSKGKGKGEKSKGKGKGEKSKGKGKGEKGKGKGKGEEKPKGKGKGEEKSESKGKGKGLEITPGRHIEWDTPIDTSLARKDDHLSDFVDIDWWRLYPVSANKGETPDLKFQQKAKAAYEARWSQYDELMRTDSEQKWMRKMVKEGTLADQIASLVMLTQMCPMFSSQWIKILLQLAGKKNRNQSVNVIDAIKELFVENLLPDRRLKFMSQRKTGDRPAKGSVEEDKYYAAYYFEDFIKTSFASFVQLVVDATHDDNKFYKKKALETVKNLLLKKPEQERALLQALVNKFGDKDSKIASQVGMLLHTILKEHPAMKKIIILEVESFLGRDLSRHARYNSLQFISEIKLNALDGEVAAEVARIFLEQLQLFVNGVFDEKKQGTKRKNRKQKKLEKKNFGSISPDDNRLIRAVIAGLNRVMLFLPKSNHLALEPEVLAKLFKLCHIAPASATRIVILKFLYKFLSLYQAVPDRFFRALYEQANLFETFAASNKFMMFNLLSEAIKEDNVKPRAIAMMRRCLQVAVNDDPSVNIAALMMIKQTDGEVGNTLLKPLLHVTEDDDEEERFGDQADQSENSEEKSKPEEAKKDGEDEAKKSDGKYNYTQRDPKFANADQTRIWELHAMRSHFHPWVKEMARNMTDDPTMAAVHIDNYKGDPFDDFSSAHFLDRFTYAKKKDQKDASRFIAKTNGAAFTALVNSETSVHKTNPVPHERFFHKYFNDQFIKQERDILKAARLEGKDEEAEDNFFDRHLQDEMRRQFPHESGDVDSDDIGDSEMGSEAGEVDQDAFAAMDGIGSDVEEVSGSEEEPGQTQFSDGSDDDMPMDEEFGEDFSCTEDEEEVNDEEEEFDGPPAKRTKFDKNKSRLAQYKQNAFASADDFADVMGDSD